MKDGARSSAVLWPLSAYPTLSGSGRRQESGRPNVPVMASRPGNIEWPTDAQAISLAVYPGKRSGTRSAIGRNRCDLQMAAGHVRQDIQNYAAG